MIFKKFFFFNLFINFFFTVLMISLSISVKYFYNSSIVFFVFINKGAFFLENLVARQLNY